MWATFATGIALITLCAVNAAHYAHAEQGAVFGILIALPIAYFLFLAEQLAPMRPRTRILLRVLALFVGLVVVHILLSPPRARDIVRQMLATELPAGASNIRLWREDPINAANYFIRFGASADECVEFAKRAGLELERPWLPKLFRISQRVSPQSGKLGLPDWWAPPKHSKLVWSGERNGRVVRLIRADAADECFLEMAVMVPR